MKSFLFPTLLSGRTAFSPLGQTEEECDAQYGEVVAQDDSRPGFPRRCYKMGDLDVSVILLNGVSALLSVSCGRGLKDQTIDNVLEAAAEGQGWGRAVLAHQDIFSQEMVCPRADGAVEAELTRMYISPLMILTIRSREMREAWASTPTL
jgi:hypothetical protein